jgi:hypothetical protein
MRLRTALVCGMVFALLTVASVPAAYAIWIEENTVEVNEQVVTHTLEISISTYQLLLGPIHGWLVALAAYPFVGTPPRIVLWEIDLDRTQPLGGWISPDGSYAVWDYDSPIVTPCTITATVGMEFDPCAPPGAWAEYHFSSVDAGSGLIETLVFASEAPAGVCGTDSSSWTRIKYLYR